MGTVGGLGDRRENFNNVNLAIGFVIDSLSLSPINCRWYNLENGAQRKGVMFLY